MKTRYCLITAVNNLFANYCLPNMLILNFASIAQFLSITYLKGTTNVVSSKFKMDITVK